MAGKVRHGGLIYKEEDGWGGRSLLRGVHLEAPRAALVGAAVEVVADGERVLDHRLERD